MRSGTGDGEVAGPGQRLGKNLDRYCGDVIDVRQTLAEIISAADKHGWERGSFATTDGFELLSLHRPARSDSPATRRIYLSAGIHGDEPAGPRAALRLLQEDRWPENAELWFCPCLNPVGFTLNCRENARGLDLNRAYLNPSADEIIAHINWLERQPAFDLCLLLHEDWESNGFYLYEQNPLGQRSLAEPMIDAVERVCPIDPNELIEGRPASRGIIRPNLDPDSRPDWPEAFYLIRHKTRLSYTLEAPSDFALQVREQALITAVHAALNTFCGF
ncbi:MAG TPA: M14 family metallocarboxypeptidase [Verrucomicrobiae bacterium]|nr:M14 family metallocarboxypeptidase [Verrucomicrobiae bacterium]